MSFRVGHPDERHVNVRGVDVVHWNPRRSRPFVGRLPLPPIRLLNNFGDLLGPLIVAEIARRGRLPSSQRRPRPRLLAVGSILRLGRDRDCVWGPGINGKSAAAALLATQLDIRAVRGPLSADYLRRHGFSVPEVFGDPALLWPTLFPQETTVIPRTSGMLLVPNFHDLADYSGANVLDPRSPVHECISAIRSSSFVCGSSLHGIILAEAFGVPARVIRSSHEDPFKYEDYFLGTGRTGYTPARDVDDALNLGGEPAPAWDPAPLLAAFPHDLWKEH